MTDSVRSRARQLLGRRLPPRAAAALAAAVIGIAGAVVHALALRGYEAWTRGASEVESQLVRPELLALDLGLQTVALAQNWAHRGPAHRASDGPIVQVVSLSSEEGDVLDALEAVIARLDALDAAVIVIDLPDLELSLAARRASAERLAAAVPPGSRAPIERWASSPEAAIAVVAARRPVVLAYRTAFLSRGPSHVSRVAPDAWEALAHRAQIDGSVALASASLPVTVVTGPPATLIAAAHPAARHDLVDPDGRTRREALTLANGPSGGRVVLPTIALVSASLAMKKDAAAVLAGAPLGADGFLLVDHRVRSKAWTSRSVLGLARSEAFAGSVAILGLPRRDDPVSFPLAHAAEPEISHAEHTASAVGNLLRGEALRRPPAWSPSAASTLWQGIGPLLTLVLAFGAGLLTLSLPGRRGFGGDVGALLAAATCTVVPGFLWMLLALFLLSRGIWVDTFHPIVTIAAAAIGTATVDFLLGGVERRQLRGLVFRALPLSVAQRALRDPGFLALGGTQREITVLFADLRGFTTFSEASSPERVVRVLREYQSEMVRLIRAYGGTVDKLMGDGTMAFFGAPQDDATHAATAVRAALAMQQALVKLNARWRAESIPPLTMGIGIQTGVAVVGNMGTPEMISYTAIGDTVNVAARLEGLTKETGANILVGDATFARLGLGFTTREVGPVPVRGRSASVLVHEVLVA